MRGCRWILFTSGEPRWLGTQFNRPGEPEQPRVLLVGVPYALKSADADTLGGKPASAYVLAPPPVGAAKSSGRDASTTVTAGPNISGDGTKNYIPIWATPNYLLSSVIYQATGGNVGIGTQTAGSNLDVAGDINLTGSFRYYGSPILRVPSGELGSIAVGFRALADTPGRDNAATGRVELLEPRSNTAIGSFAIGSNTGGIYNTAIGYGALSSNTMGAQNIAVGAGAALNVADNGSNNIHIGNMGSSGDNNAIWIGTTGFFGHTSFFVAGVRGITTGNNDAIPVMIDSAGQLGTVRSSRRFKEDIEDMGAASHDLMRLRPVTYRYKQPFADGSKPIQYGLIAEEVAEVYPGLVAHSADGQVETVKYQVLDSMLLNEVQRLERENQSLQERLAKIEAMLASQGKQN